MLLTLVQLHILLAAVPALTGWPVWAALPIVSAHVQNVRPQVVQAVLVHRAAPAPSVSHAPVQAALRVADAAAHSASLCFAHAPRAP